MSTDAPEMAVEPIYATFHPQDAPLSQGPQGLRLASAVLEVKPESLTAVSGVGGPAGQPVEPAARPAGTKAAATKAGPAATTGTAP